MFLQQITLLDFVRLPLKKEVNRVYFDFMLTSNTKIKKRNVVICYVVKLILLGDSL